jgi:hypothetical protein
MNRPLMVLFQYATLRICGFLDVGMARDRRSGAVSTVKQCESGLAGFNFVSSIDRDVTMRTQQEVVE